MIGSQYFSMGWLLICHAGVAGLDSATLAVAGRL